MAAPPRRLSPAERRRRRTRTLALVVAIALVATLAVPLAALAAPGQTASQSTPSQGPASQAPAGSAPRTAPEAEEVRDALGTTDAHEVWMWTTAFLRGEASALDDPLESADQWVAATEGGTRTAWRDPDEGRVVLAGWDDDAELGQALRELAPEDRLVTDEGEWLVLRPDGTVSAVLPERVGDAPTGPVTLEEFQSERSARWEAVLADAQDGDGEGMAGGGAGASADEDGRPGTLRSVVPWAVGAALLLTGTALAVRARREHREPPVGAAPRTVRR
ncbi:hypothetical protein [Actinotalea sp. Marseille-Q4924]|uniref:hypothetical protein n=1 Tax=Actinotalea sp. Marseille-Q4924 TaxID=2866571 RepID=UPI001CE3B6F9|nr:hypothetical protein [Actinotalea sp. Marseille-Q4924]